MCENYFCVDCWMCVVDESGLEYCEACLDPVDGEAMHAACARDIHTDGDEFADCPEFVEPPDEDGEPEDFEIIEIEDEDEDEDEDEEVDDE